MKMKIFGFTTAIIFTMLISCCIRINITPDDDNYTKKISSGGTTVNIKQLEEISRTARWLRWNNNQ